MENHSQGRLRPEWSSKVIESYKESQSPVVAIINNNQNKFTFAASDDFNSLVFKSGVVEEDAL